MPIRGESRDTLGVLLMRAHGRLVAKSSEMQEPKSSREVLGQHGSHSALPPRERDQRKVSRQRQTSRQDLRSDPRLRARRSEQAYFGCKGKIARDSCAEKTMLVASETTSAGQIAHEMVVQNVEKNTGLDVWVDELSSEHRVVGLSRMSPCSAKVHKEKSTRRIQTSLVVHTPTATTSTRKQMTKVSCSSTLVIKRDAHCPSHARQQGIEL